MIIVKSRCNTYTKYFFLLVWDSRHWRKWWDFTVSKATGKMQYVQTVSSYKFVSLLIVCILWIISRDSYDWLNYVPRGYCNVEIITLLTGCKNSKLSGYNWHLPEAKYHKTKKNKIKWNKNKMTMRIFLGVYGDNRNRSVAFGLVGADWPNKRQAINNPHNDLNISGAPFTNMV